MPLTCFVFRPPNILASAQRFGSVEPIPTWNGRLFSPSIRREQQPLNLSIPGSQHYVFAASKYPEVIGGWEFFHVDIECAAGSIPGPSFRLKFLPVQENLPEPGFVLKNSLRAEIVIRANAANYLQSTYISFEAMFDISIWVRIGMIRA